jgi:putative transposase
MNDKYESAYFHIYNRGSDKRIIFMDKWDYERFLFCLKEFNTEKRVNIRDLKETRANSTPTSKVGVSPTLEVGVVGVQADIHKLVEIFCFCLMPNHYHLILKESIEGGTAKFMNKLNAGYTKYFNLKYKRSGHLFQGKYKSKEINADFYLTYLTGYIHLNPKFPEQYKYSSYLDYLGKKKTDFLDFRPEELEIKIEDYDKFITDLKNNKEALKKVEAISLE